MLQAAAPTAVRPVRRGALRQMLHGDYVHAWQPVSQWTVDRLKAAGARRLAAAVSPMLSLDCRLHVIYGGILPQSWLCARERYTLRERCNLAASICMRLLPD